MKRIIRFAITYKAFAFAAVFAAAALVLDLLNKDLAAHIILAIVAGASVIPLLIDMWKDLRSGSYGIDILAATAIVVAIVMHEYWAAIVIVLMLTGGESLEDYAERRSKSELTALLGRAPQKAHVLRRKQVIDVTVKTVKVGDFVVIKTGEVIPVDGIITDGKTTIDESSITGESLPITKKIGDEVLSGAVNLDGSITIKVSHDADSSQYQQIIKLVQSAANSQSPFVRLADRYSLPFTIVSFVIAGSAWAISGDSMRFLQVLVVATPCPLILAAPIAIISGMSRASRAGAIIKNGTALERLASVRSFAFDKTGTLTAGKLKVSQVTAFAGQSKETILGYAASLESHSSHVLATAITTAAEKAKLKIRKAKHVNEQSGSGLSAQLDGKKIMVGRLDWLQDNAVILPKTFKTTSVKSTATYVAVNNQLAGYITFADEPRPESKTTLERLKAAGIEKFLMITGDNKASAQVVAKLVGIKDITAGALPADKLNAIELVTTKPIAFVGDGVNDAPVLTAADVGIALGAKGSTAASESADVVVMVDDVSKVADAYIIAKRSIQIGRQSILTGIALSVVLMFIFSTGKFQPLYGALIQELVDVVVIFNALRAHVIKV